MPGFDKTIDMLRMGDNVVWQIDKLEDYLEVVKPYIKKAREDHRRIVYFRFGGHAPVLKEADDIQVYYVDAAQGFEQFATTIHQIAEREGRKAFYVFDCLTELLKFWYSDLMIGNFLKLPVRFCTLWIRWRILRLCGIAMYLIPLPESVRQHSVCLTCI